MSGIVRLSFDPGVVEYRLGGGHGCDEKGRRLFDEPDVADVEFGYRANGAERPLRWIGSGVAAHGFVADAEFTDEDLERARALMRGVDPETGEQVIKAKLAVYEDAKVPVAPLLAAAVEREAAGVVLGTKALRESYARMQRAVSGPRGDRAAVRADEAGRVADEFGLDVEAVWGAGVYESAYSNLFTTETVTREDGTAVERVIDRRQVVGNAGYDFTFTLPKSPSLLLAFADPATAAGVEEAMYGQVQTAFGWLESRTAYVMRGKHGGRHADGSARAAEVVAGDGFRGWTMVHRSARPVDGAEVGDPHWHVHTTFANMTRAEDGAYGTVAAGGRDLMRHMRPTAALYEAMVRYHLADRFGVQFERRASGQWEIAGIPDETIAQFSKRSSEVADMLREMGFDPEDATSAAARIANQRSRSAKGELTSAADATLQALWRQQAIEAGTDPSELIEAAFTGRVNPTQQADRPQLVADLVAQLSDPETGLTSHARRFTRLDAITAIAHALPGGIESPEHLEQLTDEVLSAGGFVGLGVAGEYAEGGRGVAAASHMRDAALSTTRDVVAAERYILARASDEVPVYAAVSAQQLAAGVQAAEAEQGFAFNGEQLDALTRVALDGRAVVAVTGAPGTGKTTMMRGLRHAFTGAGVRIGGAATAAIAAQNLQAEAGISSRTVAQILVAEHALDDLDVLVLDEANLTEDRARAALYRRAEAAGVRIVEIGDGLQLKGVGVGSLYRRVHEVTGGPQLEANRRQRDVLDRDAIAAWREGRWRDALASWAARDALAVTETPAQARVAMLERWREERLDAPDVWTGAHGVVMLAGTNAAVDDLNAAAHAIRSQTGEITDVRQWTLTGGQRLSLGVGEVVVLRANDRDGQLTRGHEVLNGTRAIVEGIDENGDVTVSWRGEDDAAHTAVLSDRYVRSGGVRLGYALTVHAAEGLTVGEQWTDRYGRERGGAVLVSAAGGDDALLHVATSRHKRALAIFTSSEEWLDEQDEWTRGPARDADERTDRVIDAIAASSQRSRVNANERPTLADLGSKEEAEAWDAWVQRWQPTAAEAPGPQNDDQQASPAVWPAMRRWLVSTTPGRSNSPVAADATERVRRSQQRERTGAWWDVLSRSDVRSRALIGQAHARAEQLGAQVAADCPAWVRHLQPSDASEAARKMWLQRVGNMAAYREAFGVTDERSALGPRPEHATYGALWDAANEALPRPATSTDAPSAAPRRDTRDEPSKRASWDEVQTEQQLDRVRPLREHSDTQLQQMHSDAQRVLRRAVTAQNELDATARSSEGKHVARVGAQIDAERGELALLDAADEAQASLAAAEQAAHDALAAKIAHENTTPKRRERAAWETTRTQLAASAAAADAPARAAGDQAVDTKLAAGGDTEWRQQRRADLTARLNAAPARTAEAEQRDAEHRARLQQEATAGDGARDQLTLVSRELAYRGALSAGDGERAADAAARDEAEQRARERYNEPLPEADRGREIDR